MFAVGRDPGVSGARPPAGENLMPEGGGVTSKVAPEDAAEPASDGLVADEKNDIDLSGRGRHDSVPKGVLFSTEGRLVGTGKEDGEALAAIQASGGPDTRRRERGTQGPGKRKSEGK